jgi:hypothetical protein
MAMDSTQRTAFLAEACGNDESLYRELALLVAQPASNRSSSPPPS